MDTTFCERCHTIAAPIKRTKGSMTMELFLWLFFLLPGLFYSIWRLTTRAEVCSACGSDALIPPASPKALSLRREHKKRAESSYKPSDFDSFRTAKAG